MTDRVEEANANAEAELGEQAGIEESDSDELYLTDPRSERRQYLATYSQCDLKKFPIHQSFGQMMSR